MLVYNGVEYESHHMEFRPNLRCSDAYVCIYLRLRKRNALGDFMK